MVSTSRPDDSSGLRRADPATVNASNKQFGRAERTIGTRMLEVCAYDDGSCKGFVYDSSEAEMRRKVAKLTGDLISPNSARGRELTAERARGSGEVGRLLG